MTDFREIHRSHAEAGNIQDALVIREKNLTLVTLHNGDIPFEKNNGYGLYFRDCRYLSGYLFRIGSLAPTEILSSDENGFSSVTMLTNPGLRDNDGVEVGKTTVSIRRDRFIAGLVSETISLVSFNDFPVSLDIGLQFGSDFDDIFTVRGITSEDPAKEVLQSYQDGTFTLACQGRDGHRRETRIDFQPAPDQVTVNTCIFKVALAPRERKAIAVQITVVDIPPGDQYQPDEVPIDRRLKMIRASYVETSECCSNVQTDNHIFNKVFLRSLSDLRMLYMINRGEVHYSAGVPWYDALFGRDSLLAALQVIPYNPTVSRSTLKLLATYQGRETCDWKDEAPGRILHELRLGEMANLGEIPETPYYGSVDATPLFLILLAEYIDWTGDMGLFHELEQNVDAALRWIDGETARDPDGFLRYSTRSSFGLYNQGWKDSYDSISHADGSLAQHPIALAEVQGYVYQARRRISLIFDRLGRHDDAKRLQKDAAGLYWSFNDKFWLPERQFYAMALDAAGPCKVLSSNPAQALWSEIVDPGKADVMVRRLFEPDLFTGWGIRTLSSGERRYNPLGYHNGTVWPHDNSLVAMGLCKYGFKDRLDVLFTSMHEAASYYNSYRLPELFGGFHREESDIPIKYPVACSPQAWSAGSIPYMLTASLGFVPDALNQKLTMVKPHLPRWLKKSTIFSLHVGNASARIEFQREGESTLVNVVEKRGGRLDVNVVY